MTRAIARTGGLTGLLARHAEEAGSRTAFRFLDLDGGADREYTWRDLYAHALGFARQLTDRGLSGQRALLVYDTGLDFLVAFLGCLLAGVTAVPAPPPRPPYHRSLRRLVAIQLDCAAPLVVTRPAVRDELRRHLPVAPELSSVDWLTVDEVAPDLAETGLSPHAVDAPAYLQYTSGSTSQPKGVQVSQAEVLANCAAMHDAWRHGPDSVMVSWLPMFHDMGLVYNALLPVWRAMPTMLMSPSAFVRDPVRWLRVHSRYRGTHSIAPNFGFDLCVRKVDPADIGTLDLSCWQVAANASEPVRAATMRRFAATFAAAGLRPETLIPAYGLAEATLIVTAARAGDGGARIGTFDRDALAAGTARPVTAPAPGPAAAAGATTPSSGAPVEVVSCGRPLPGFDVRVVDPEARRPVPDGRIGEIWVAGDSVTQGYFRHPEATATSFAARLADGTGPFLRTGDLGFGRHGELFVTGRRKDLLIVAGRNYHPQDIEATSFEAHPALRPGCAAAFGVDDGAEEHLVIVQEVVDDQVPAAVAAEAVGAVRRAVVEAYELRVDAVVLIRRATLSKTSSGKIQRSDNRARFQAGSLDVVASWRSTLFGGDGVVVAATAPAGSGPRIEDTLPAGGPVTAAGLRSWLRDRLATLTGVPAGGIDDRTPLASYGLGSVGVAELTGALADLLGRPLPDTLVYDHPTVQRLTTALVPAATADVAGEPPAPADPVGYAPTTDRVRQSPPAPHPSPTGHRPEGLARPGDVAIIGIGCRVPGASSPDEFWDLLRSGTDAVREVPPDRWSGHAEPALRWAGLLPDLTRFDHDFFGISPREARLMDPQQRMLLEVAWEAVEDAGMDPTGLAGSDTGVFVGVWSPEFGLRAGLAGFAEPYLATGSAHSIAANRLSYALGLHGPSIALDTACSSSLVAVHLAVRALLDEECGIALAGGGNVVLAPEVTASFARAHLLSPTGRCRSFGAGADGYVRSEGAGVVVLKRMADALADGDPVYAVIRGSAVNHDGRTNGLTAPSAAAQQAVIRRAHRRAGVRGQDIDLVEAHGSGTAVGDVIEATALGATVGGDRDGPGCLVGSVKSNLGHLESAAGVAGLIRATLALHHGVVPPTLHAEPVNPRIDLGALGLRVNTSAVPLEPAGRPALAGVSSFGFGGANAHLVLEQPAPADRGGCGPDRPERAVLLPVSARSTRALAALAGRYRDLLADPDLDPADLCHSAGRRAQHPLRTAVVGGTRAELVAALDRLSAADPSPDQPATAGPHPESPDGGVLFRYAGQGPVAGVGGALFMQERVFRRAVEECDDVLRDLAGWSLIDLLRAGPAEPWSARIAAPVRVARQIGLTDLLGTWGIRPAAVTGRGVGEVAAGYAAGLLDRATAMALAVHLGEVWSGTAAEPPPETPAGRPGLGLWSAAHGGPVRWVDDAYWERVAADEGRSSLALPADDAAAPGMLGLDLDPVGAATGAPGAGGTGGGPGHRPDAGAAPVAVGTVLTALAPGSDDRAALLAVAGRLYASGLPLDWAEVAGSRRRIRLPRYPWDATDLGLPWEPAGVGPPRDADPTGSAVPGAGVPAVTLAAPEPVGAPPVVPGRSRDDLRELVRDALAELLGSAPERIDNHRTFHDLGLDSMSGIDLHAQLERDLGTTLPETAVLNHPTVARLADFLASQLAGTGSGANGATPAGAAPDPASATAVPTVSAPDAGGAAVPLTDEQVVDQLLADLAGLLPALVQPDRPEEDRRDRHR